MSKHACPVVEVTARKHPNADTLGLVNVWGYQCVVQLKEFPIGVPKVAVFVPPDYVVPPTDRWAFLSGHNRITTRKFRGERSEGIIIPNDTNLKVGMDAMLHLGIQRWVSPSEADEAKKEAKKRNRLPWWNLKRYYWMWQEYKHKRDKVKCKPGYNAPVYDVENLRRYPVLAPGEKVIITEKIHGCNARFTWDGRRMYVGSHNLWKNPKESTWWTRCLEQHPWIMQMCMRYPGVVFYGEIYGASIQPLTYGVPKGEFGFHMFDIRENGEWASWNRLDDYYFLDEDVRGHWVPVLYVGPWSEEEGERYAKGQSTLDRNTLREGIVVEPWTPRTEAEIGRVKVKLVNPAYLEVKHEGQEQFIKEHGNGRSPT